MCFYKCSICNFTQNPDLQHVPGKWIMYLEGQTSRCFFLCKQCPILTPFPLESSVQEIGKVYASVLPSFFISKDRDNILDLIINYHCSNNSTLNPKKWTLPYSILIQSPLARLEKSFSTNVSINLFFPMITLSRRYQDGLRAWL